MKSNFRDATDYIKPTTKGYTNIIHDVPTELMNCVQEELEVPTLNDRLDSLIHTTENISALTRCIQDYLYGGHTPEDAEEEKHEDPLDYLFSVNDKIHYLDTELSLTVQNLKEVSDFIK